jgi:hypothetical protein
VTQETIGETICHAGYAKQVRPGTVYTNGVKQKLMRQQGIPLERAGDYELDHVVPLTLGGNPRQLSNLMLQPWEGDHGAKVKDKLEVRLKSAVCRGRMSLREAQSCIAENWESCQDQHPGRRTAGVSVKRGRAGN